MNAFELEEARKARQANYERYRELATAKDLTDFRVAQGANLSTTVFSEWKKGKSQPKTDKLLKIAAFLGVTIDDIIA